MLKAHDKENLKKKKLTREWTSLFETSFSSLFFFLFLYNIKCMFSIEMLLIMLILIEKVNKMIN
jgi:hypothetical protein